ncbi:MAG: M56 family metallopeptidase [Polyangiaceae bacterium]
MSAPELEHLAGLLCYGLAHSLWQATLVALAYWFSSRAFGLGPVGRHRLGTLGLLLLPVALLLTILKYAASPDSASIPFVAAGARPAIVTAAPTVGAAAPASGDSWALHGELLVAVVWMFVVALLCVRGLWLLVRDRRILRSAQPLEAHWQCICEALARDVGAPARLRFVAIAGESVVPYTLGVLRPVVVLPLSMLLSLSPECVEAIVRHELGHVVRRHFLLNLLQSCTEIIFFFHPAVWWLGRAVRQERELCCDLDALAGGESPVGYARALLSLEELRRTGMLPGLSKQHAQPVPGVGALGSGLRPRIERIVSMKKQADDDKAVPRGAARARRRAALGWAASLVAAGLCATGIAACTGALDASAGDDGPEAAQVGSELSIVWLPPDVKRYAGLLNHEAARTGVDADLLALMVLAESGGDPQAKSPAGARGLMQLMPSTARAISRRSGIPLGNDDELYDPALNLKLGAELVRELSSHFAAESEPERLRLVWSAYNAGSAAVERHLKNADVPLPEETRAYVAFLSDLYQDKGLALSPHYEAWRKRVLALRLAESQGPAEGAQALTFGAGSSPGAHSGVDVSLSHGTDVEAVLAGTVIEAGDAPDGFGKRITLKHRSGLTTHYSHLGSVAVKVGDTVKQGDALGEGADAGPHGPHIHFEVRDQGALVDAKPFLHEVEHRESTPYVSPKPEVRPRFH